MTNGFTHFYFISVCFVGVFYCISESLFLLLHFVSTATFSLLYVHQLKQLWLWERRRGRITQRLGKNALHCPPQSCKSVRVRTWVCQNVLGPISGLHTKVFYNIQSNDFFLSWRIFVVLIAVASVSEVIVIFLQLILELQT